MRKHLWLILIFMFLFMASCSQKDKDPNQPEVNEVNNEKNLAESSVIENENQVKKSLFAEGELKNKEFSNIVAKLEYLEDDDFLLKIRIEQKHDISFTTDNQNVYGEIYISSEKLENNGILYEKDINDSSLFAIPLIDNKIPPVTEILIDKDSKILTTDEKKAIIEKDKGLWISVQIRDPQGYILEISNTIFEEKQ